MNKLNVLILSHMYPNKMLPNHGIFIHNQTKHLMKLGCDVKVISPVPFAPKFLWFKSKWKCYGQIPTTDLIDDVPVYYPRYINVPGTAFRKLSSISMYRGVNQLVLSFIKKYKPDIIHAHTATPSGFLGLKISSKYSLPMVCSMRGSDINIYPYYDSMTMLMTKKVISSTDQIVTVSNALKIATEKIAVPRESIKVVYNGCDTDKFNKCHEHRYHGRMQRGIMPDDKVLIFVGNLKESKGVHELIDAFIQLRSKYANLHLIMLGDGPEYSTIYKTIVEHDLQKWVHMIGAHMYDKVPYWLNAADIFLLPTHYEGMPNALLEAMSCGLPVIATTVGGIPEVIRDKENGLLIPPKDSIALRKAVTHLLSTQGLAERMGTVARDSIIQKFSWMRSAEEMINVYRKTIYGHA